MKKNVFLLLFAGVALALASCSSPKMTAASQTMTAANLNSIENNWIHAFEEDMDQVRVYHNSDYDYKPSRGREKFSILPDGLLRITPLSPNDAPIVYEGSWKVDGTTLALSYNGKTLIYEIVHVQPDTLKMILK
jgi:hypothetical protein